MDGNEHVAGHHEAEGPKQCWRQRARRRHPWQPRSGVRARGGRAPGWAEASEGGKETHRRSVLEQQGARRRVAHSLNMRRPWGARSGAWLPRCHFVEHVARAMEPDLESVFGIFRAHSDLGACSKVVVHKLLSNFY